MSIVFVTPCLRPDTERGRSPMGPAYLMLVVELLRAPKHGLVAGAEGVV